MDVEKIKLIIEFFGKKLISVSLLSFFIAIMIFAVEVLFAWSIQNFFNLLGLSNQATNSQSHLNWIPHNSLEYVILFFILIAFSRAILMFAQMYCAGMSTIEFETLNRKRISDWAFRERSSSLAEVTTLFNDITVGAGNFYSSVVGIFSRILILVLLLLTLLKFSMIGTIVILLLVSLISFPFLILSRKIRFFSSTLHHELDSAIKKIMGGVKNSLFLHIYGINLKENDETKIHLSNYLSKYERYYFYSSAKNIVPQIIGILVLSVMMVASKKFHLLPDSLLIQYFYLFTRFVQFIGEAGNLTSYVNLTKPRFLSMWNWWLSVRKNLSDEQFEANNRFTSPIGIKVSNLTYAYNSGEPILNNIQIDIVPGSVFLITGPSGAGKSTLLALILGMLKPSKGEISVYTKDNPSVKSLIDVRGRLFSSIGYVGADSYIIRGTFRENLLYGSHSVPTDKEILRVISLAGCDFIHQLPGGLNHVLTEQGEGLSAGQKQRLSLARALIRGPKLLILDEATANLDLETEDKIIDNLNDLRGDMTIVVVTHRDSMLRIADKHLILSEIENEII